MYALHYSRNLLVCVCTYIIFKQTISISRALIWSGDIVNQLKLCADFLGNASGAVDSPG